MLGWLRKLFQRKKSNEDLEVEDLMDYAKDMLLTAQQKVDVYGRDSTSVADDEDTGDEY